MPESSPVLYSFRRCPYAMRARMALHAAGVPLEHREILLKNKPPSMLAVSPKGTVPVLVLEDGRVLDESWEIVKWALDQNDPADWLGDDHRYLRLAGPLVERCDGPFKEALDKYKYADRHPLSAAEYRGQGLPFLQDLETLLQANTYLLADTMTVADIAIMPFVRQFALVDRAWFDAADLTRLANWLDRMIDSPLFHSIMQKQPLWQFETK